jgi:cell division protein FtsZ
MIDFAQEESTKRVASIKVLGIGGAGGNTVNSIMQSGCEQIECIVANTDAQALENATTPHRIQIGIKATKGLGAGANPELGQRAAQEDLDKILEAVEDADIVFLTCGMGGGTGSGALPVVARALKERGILSIAVVTKPFAFEGRRRTRVAEEALERLKQEVDTLIVIPNQRLLDVVDQKVSMLDAFTMINDVLSHSVKGISDIITKPGHINVDFADVKAIMKDMGLAVLGTGRASGPDRAWLAAEQAISSPLLENMSIDGARGVLLNITGGPSLGLHEISEAASVIYEKADEDANIIMGSVIDPNVGDEIHVTIIATGFNKKPAGSRLYQGVDTAALAVYETKLHNEEVEKKAAEELVQELLKAKEEASRTAPLPVAENNEALDLEDLDVPSFMRKEMLEKSKNV